MVVTALDKGTQKVYVRFHNVEYTEWTCDRSLAKHFRSDYEALGCVKRLQQACVHSASVEY